MISISCESVITAFPVVVAFFWPLVAAIYGSESVVRQSLVICLYFIICDFLNKKFSQLLRSDLRVLDTFINIAVLVFLFSQSFIKVPSFAINGFAFILTHSEPLIVLIEIRQIVLLITRFGQYLADCANCDTEDSQPYFAKSVILLITSGGYSLSFFTLRYSLTSAQTSLFTYAAALLIVIEIMKIVATLYADDGIISDTSLLFLMSSLAFYLSIFGDNNRNNISSIFNENEWLETQMSFNGKSLIYQLLSLPDVSTAYANEGLRWAKQHYGLGFWLALIIRITCALTWLIDLIDHNDYGKHDDQWTSMADDDDDDEERWCAATRWLGRHLSLMSPQTLIKVMTTLIYTEMLLQQLPVGDSWLAVGCNWPSGLRLFQCFSFGIYYFYSLYCQTCDYD